MELLKTYTNLDDALRLFRKQVIESIPYAQENFPPLDSPEKIFNYLKSRTRYKKDPKGTELFQCLPTLMEDNYHGIVGAGDCDCFTIAALATLLANGFYDCGIVLVGRNPSPFPPVHIYAYVNYDGERKIFDLTNRVFNYERSYPYKQFIPFKLNQSEKNMMLQLADGGPGQPGYIYFPKKRVHVREDYFDNLKASEFQNMCLDEGIDLEELEGLSRNRAQRQHDREAKKERRLKRKALKPRNQRKMLRVQSKNEARKMKAQGKLWSAMHPAQDTPDEQQPDEEQPDDTMQPDDGSQPDDDSSDQDGGEMEEGNSYAAPLISLAIVAGGYFLGRSVKKHSRRRAA